MTDRLFFPLVLLASALLVWIALRPATGGLPTGSVSGGGTDYTQITVEGANLNRIIAGGEARIGLAPDLSVLTIEAEVGKLTDDPILGPHFRLAGDIETMFAGRTIEIRVRARPADKYGASRLLLNYSAGKSGESGWQTFPLSADFADYAFTYRVPDKIGDLGVDYLALRPEVPSKRRAVDIQSVTFKLL